jgi:hypothetical protein
MDQKGFQVERRDFLKTTALASMPAAIPGASLAGQTAGSVFKKSRADSGKLPFHLFDRTHLGKEGSRIGNIPVLTEFSIPKSEHVDHVEFYSIARGRMI